ncbi:MAG: Mrp/NBP35 family ATP-binding protein [Deltaproteobacteria bacterium]|nr:Mrp/NBP35 family ATP-binding protein [Deltaproteobacteria bacterium]MBF0525396.1 Mrp/NBP35 family ATP-binding protein [Deltaproteobacteria bacterium]
MSENNTSASCPASAGGRKPEIESQDTQIQRTLSKIKNTIMVMSGKGGVGKSSFSVNLAVALAARGLKVGLMDVDLHGPDIPRMLGLASLADLSRDSKVLFPVKYNPNLSAISIEVLFSDKDSAVIWRGPVKINVIRQFLSDVYWGPLDFLIIDAPPGTGDEPLTVAQTVPQAKAIVLTTPQEISLADVRKSISFCKQVNMEILGVVENMSGLTCPHCGQMIPLFSQGGGQTMAEKMEVPFLGRIPIDPKLVEASDQGRPYMDDPPDSPTAQAFKDIVEAVLAKLPEEK